MSEKATLTDRIDALLPQTQCEQCGYPGCRPYAEAIARDEADINQCPPGGQAGIDALADLLGRASKALDPAHGEYRPPRVAWIDEAVCIGCTKCIQACPVDAIVGARKLMHTVIAEECTGCDLCLAPCPVDCIHMLPTSREQEPEAVQQRRRDIARERFRQRNERLARRRAAHDARRATDRVRRQRNAGAGGTAPTHTLPDRDARRATARAALERARARRRRRTDQPS
ncbi:electron transport complex subunit RsxB [Spiribacter sp. 221]|uniref:Electron transport complex subunit RsxB n=1 Tax=Spiribacter onubensis TaxID=3122420 RepID=A0ABV3S8Z6_9GAMM